MKTNISQFAKTKQVGIKTIYEAFKILKENGGQMLGRYVEQSGILSGKQNNTVIMKIIMTAVLFIFGVSISFSQVTDYDGNTYETVIIGSQEWMAENLNVEHYRNGDEIPQVQDYSEWYRLRSGAWCYYENDSENGKIYGKLYNWYAVTDPRKLAPEGWHIPTNEEWKQLSDYLGGDSIAGGKLKSITKWKSPNEGATNSSGFTAFPGGYRYFNGYFHHIGSCGFFWCASKRDASSFGFLRELFYYSSRLSSDDDDKTDGFSVRCVKDY